MKRNIIIVIIWIIVIAVAYCGYKLFLISNYKAEVNAKLQTELRNVDSITIKTNPNIDPNTRVKFRKLVYKSIGSNFKFDEEKIALDGKENYYSYHYSEPYSDTYNAKFQIGITYSFHDMLTADKLTTYNFEYKNVNRRELLKRYDINNDYDIVKYTIDNYDRNKTLLSSSDSIKLDYAIKTFASVVMPASKVTLIEGDYQGFMFTLNDKYYEVHLVYGDQSYVISFINGNGSEYFTLDSIKEFISNIKFVDR